MGRDIRTVSKGPRSKKDIECNYKYFVEKGKGEYLIALEIIRTVNEVVYTPDGDLVRGYTFECPRLTTARAIPPLLKEANPEEVWQVEYTNNTIWSGVISAKRIGHKDDPKTQVMISEFNQNPELIY